MNRVVVTGIGMVSSHGVGKDEIWPKIKEGVSAIDFLKRVDNSDLKTKFGGEIADNFNAEDFIDAKEARRSDVFIRYAAAAAVLALRDSGFEINSKNEHLIGSYIGSGIGGIQTFVDNVIAYREKGPSRVSPFFVPSMVPNMAAGYVSIFNNLKGPNCATATACAAGAHAIAYAAMNIQRGDAIAMIAGGAEAPLVHVAISGFNVMRAISTRNEDPKAASRPFDRDRDGFVMAEGSGLVMLEEYEHAKKRGARIYAELIGSGMSGDAHHITSPSIDGPVICMEMALKNSGINPEDIDYINAHGTSTQQNDINETNAIKRVFGNYSQNLLVSSTKSITGHLLGAAGGLEAGITSLALCEGVVPPTINLDNPQEGCDLNYVPHKSLDSNIKIALSNSFGFGGTNCTLIFKKFEN
ncbi:beta-ketoacyl-ACP synthase II [bacterium]|jgi:3-oxoacyl-[acyl-carrier-protein] synthase II|nr:beta-ketoacyl-ACP synthase II [bacterium]NSW96083.1 beta-ketoacyl-ACP synthase II [bacterium]|tara:strand:+ start:13944 stop:15179 length:1236 start_codon:yes stop_codon:yes gene_type:complete